MFVTREHDRRVELTSEASVEAFEKNARDAGLYPYRCRQDEPEELKRNGQIDALFIRLMRERLADWVALSDDRLAGANVRCYVMGGNDDPPDVLDVLKGSRVVRDPDHEVAPLDDYSDMISCGWSNPTPWHTPREYSESDLAAQIDVMMSRVRHPESAILNMHVPPYASGLDDAPELDASLQVQATMGQTRFKPVGSTAVRAAIERYQPLVGLFGHVHEARGAIKIGRTVCINPGSNFGEGVLDGALVTIDKGKLKGAHAHI